MEGLAVEIIEDYGYFGVFILMLVENIFPPIPSELVLSFAGFMSGRTDMTVVRSIIYSTLGSLFGALILYGLGRKLGDSGIRKFVIRHGGKTGIKHENIDRAIDVYRKHAKATVFFCRMVPVVRSLISIPAGFSKMNIGVFLGLTAAGSLIWNSVMIVLGNKLGKLWMEADHYIRYYSKIVFIVILVLFVIYKAAVIFRRKRRARYRNR